MNNARRQPVLPSPYPRLRRLFLPLLGANLAAWAWALLLFGDRPFLLGTALLAYVLGLRHAVDADHIAAIDNVVRKLMQQRRRPETVGLYFSLGHSTVVVVGAVAVATTAAAFQDHLAALRDVGGMIGTSVSALFLLLIALVNLAILAGLWQSFRHLRRGAPPETVDLDAPFGGPLARLFRPLFGAISRPRQMYPLGLLFGLGFDTATEIGLLGIAAAQAAHGLSLAATLVFPALFTAAMALVDTADSTLMTGAYGWAYVNPMRKLWYNLTITGVSVLVALLIGGVEALGLLVHRLDLHGTLWQGIAALNDNLANFGFIVIALFAASWLLSASIYRWKRLDEVGG